MGLTVLYGVVSPFALFLAGRLLWGLCWSFIRQSGLMTVSRCASVENLGEAVGFYNGISRVGSVVGNALGGWAFARLGNPSSVLANGGDLRNGRSLLRSGGLCHGCSYREEGGVIALDDTPLSMASSCVMEKERRFALREVV